MFEACAGYVDHWRDTHSGVDFINARLRGEGEARTIMDVCAGKPDAATFAQFCQAWNRECIEGVPRKQVTCTRFGAGFPAVRGLASALAPGMPLGQWLATFWQAEVPDESSLERLLTTYTACRARGAGMFFLTLLLYLKDDERYLPCSPALARGMAVLCGREFTAPVRTVGAYLRYCDEARQLRERFSLLPQEVDFMLARAAHLAREAVEHG